MSKSKRRKKGHRPLTDEQITMLRETSRKRKPIEGLNSGVAVMYLDPKVIDSMTSEIMRHRKRNRNGC